MRRESFSWMPRSSPKCLTERLPQAFAMRFVIDIPEPHVTVVFAEIQSLDLQAFHVAITEDEIQPPLVALSSCRRYCGIHSSFAGEVAIGFVNIIRKRRVNAPTA